MAYRDGVAHVVEALEAERLRLIEEHRRLGRVAPPVARELAALRARVDVPLTSSVDVRQLRAALEEFDTALACARLARGPRWRRYLLRGGVVGALMAMIPMRLQDPPLGCAFQNECKERGACGLVDDMCLPTEASHCARSVVCKDWGDCELVGHRCRPSSDEDCQQSDGCRLEHACVLAFNPEPGCVRATEISPPSAKPGMIWPWYRDRGVALAHQRDCRRHNQCD